MDLKNLQYCYSIFNCHRGKSTAFALGLLLSLNAFQTLLAAPVKIATQPLFLGNATPPNVMFTVDDSGSMKWEDILNEGTDNPSGSSASELYWNNNDSRYEYRTLDSLRNPPTLYLNSPDIYENAFGSNANAKKEADLRLYRRLLCRGYNVMAYDPRVSYKPWAGVDTAGQAYTDQSLSAARPNPYETATVNISDHIYFPWNDSSDIGIYNGPNNGDGKAPADAAIDECGDVSSNANGTAVSSLSSAEQTNYANWWSYYRKRDYVVKRALSQIISESRVRMGLTTLWSGNRDNSSYNVRSLVADVDNLGDPVNPTADDNKAALMQNLFKISPANGTPLRSTLNDVGRYFDMSTTQWGNSPILPAELGGACQRNFTVVMSDGYWNGDFSGIGNLDGDNYSNTLADIADKYYNMDLAPSIANEVVPIAGVDDQTAQHLVTYTVAFGINGTLSGIPANPGDWPQPVAGTKTTIDDMRHAAYNGHGQFLSAGDPETLISSLSNAMRDIVGQSGTMASAAFSTTSIKDDDSSVIYQSDFDSSDWHGNLIARYITEEGLDYSTEGVKWDADALLADVTFSSRNLVTFNGSVGVNFDWDNLSVTQKQDLISNAPNAGVANPLSDAANISYGRNIVDYIKGDHSREGTGSADFRMRNGHRLGDIVHSAPTVVAKPNYPYPDNIQNNTDLYSKFITANLERGPTVYVGANDGMIHAFDGDSGAEIFAFLPHGVFSTETDKGLHAFADPLYRHNFYADLTATAADVFIDGAWRTYLIGGLRGGGRSVFAIDVTDPNNLTKDSVKWEFTNENLGYSFSEVLVGKMNNGKWAAVFGNGYNASGADADGTAKLFIVYLDDPGNPVILNTARGTISNGDCSDPGSDCNGLSTPELADLNGDGTIDRIYAGDIKGNLWVFSVASNDALDWAPAFSTGTPEPLFTACSPSEIQGQCDAQPITSKPTIAFHPTEFAVTSFPNVLVFFGTGRYLSDSDNSSSSTQQQSFYGVWDNSSITSSLLRSDLVEQTLTNSTTIVTDPDLGSITKSVRIISDNNVEYSGGTQYGWYIDLNLGEPELSGAERVVVDPVVYGNEVYFNTMIPVDSATCSIGTQQQGWLMSVSLTNGGEPDHVIVDINNDGLFDDGDKLNGHVIVGVGASGIPTSSRFISKKRVTTTSNSTTQAGGVIVEGVNPLGGEFPSRMSWTNN